MNEMLDDIVEWIRDVAQCYKRHAATYNNVTIEGLRVCDALEKIAYRIEAATRENRFKFATYDEALGAFIDQVQGTVKVDPDDAFGRWLFSDAVKEEGK